MLINNVKDDFRDRIHDVDRYYTDTIDQLRMTIETTQMIAKDSVSKKEKEMSELIGKNISTMNQQLEVNLNN